MALNAKLIEGLSKTILSKNFDSPKPTPEFHRELWTWFASPARFGAAAAPRGHAKSTSVTHVCTIASVLFREAPFVVLISDTESQASLFLNDIKTEFSENELLKQAFGFKRIVKDNETDFIGEFSDGSQFKIVAKGALQKLRGLKWRGMRPKLIIGDDLENDEIVLNEDRRAKFRQWFFNAVVPALADDGKIRIVGTILHFDSLLMRLMPPLGDANLRHTPLKSYSTDKNRAWLSVLYRAHPGPEDFSELLWPEKFDEERLRAIRQTYVEQGYPEGYSQEYLNHPLDEDNAYFRRQDLLPIDFNQKENEEFYAAIDMAISEKNQRAWSVIVVGGRTPTGKLRVRDVRRFRGDGYAIVDEMASVIHRYRPVLFGVEDENISKGLGPFLDKHLEELRLPSDCIIKLPPIHDKIQRARVLQAMTRTGSIEFDEEAEWWPSLYNEMLTFPRGSYSDQVDALAWLAFMIKHMTDTPTFQQISAWDDETIKRDTYDRFDPYVRLRDRAAAHRNPYTGY